MYYSFPAFAKLVPLNKEKPVPEGETTQAENQKAEPEHAERTASACPQRRVDHRSATDPLAGL
jgi:hypothetical protein